MHLYCDGNCAVLNCSCILLSCFGSLCSNVPILGVHNWYLTPSLCECIQTMTVPSSYYNIRKERERERGRGKAGAPNTGAVYIEPQAPWVRAPAPALQGGNPGVYIYIKKYRYSLIYEIPVSYFLLHKTWFLMFNCPFSMFPIPILKCKM